VICEGPIIGHVLGSCQDPPINWSALRSFRRARIISWFTVHPALHRRARIIYRFTIRFKGRTLSWCFRWMRSGCIRRQSQIHLELEDVDICWTIPGLARPGEISSSQAHNRYPLILVLIGGESVIIAKHELCCYHWALPWRCQDLPVIEVHFDSSRARHMNK
jgi:hypothetical protein